MKLKNIAVAAFLITAAITATKDASAQVIVPADNQPAVAPSPPVANPANWVASYSFTANWTSVSGATGYRLDVSTSSSFSTYIAGYQNRDVGNTTNRSVTLLNASTTYYYRVRAYNGAGTSGNSNVVNVRTLSATGPPVVITNPASLVASFSATLNGSVDPHGFPTTVRFQYGTTTNYGQITPSQNRNGHTFQNVSANITQLNANTTYHFRIVATNNGVTTNGLDRTFRTLAPNGPPVVITNPASLVASFSATLNGSVDPHGFPTTVRFEYGTTTNYGQTTPSQNRNGHTFQNVSANIPQLNANTTYHFRIVATNNGVTTNGLDRTFRTLAPNGPPVVITNPASLVASFSATLNGSVDPHGFPTTVRFQYGTTTNYGQITPSQNRNGHTFQNVSANITQLNANTTYHFRIVATNNGVTTNGLDRTFRTLASSTPTPTPTPFGTTPTPTPTPFGTTPTPPPVYVIDQIGGSIVPGTMDTGNHGDDLVTTIALPFSYDLYDQSFNAVNLSSNGNVQLTTTDPDFNNVCLPWTSHDFTIFPYWDDLRTDNLGWAGCGAYPGGMCGIYTSVSGTAPNRIFNIEWRAVYFGNTAGQANYEVRLYEGQLRFDVIYGAVNQGNSSATAGVQRDNSNSFTEYFCNGSGGAASGGQSYILGCCR